MPRVFIVIVNWNGKDDVLSCLASLRRLDYPRADIRIVVVDNASRDGSGAAIRRDHPQALLIENARNLGYAKAVNQGFAFALGEGADYVWVFNNDVVVAADSLARLVQACESDDKIGVAAPVIYSYGSPEKVDHSGYRIDLWTGRFKKLKFGLDVFRASGEEICDVDSALGCSNLIRVSCLRKIGPLRPVYQVYFEETDFNVRARQAGFRVVVVKDARVRHKNSATMNKIPCRRAYLLLRNLFLFELLNAPVSRLFVFIPYFFLVHIPYFFIRGSFYVGRVKLGNFK